MARRQPRVPPTARSVVDYSLARRAALFSLATGRASRRDVCDAQTYLRRAARYHGEATGEPCPVCRVEPLMTVTWAYGEHFPEHGNGRVRGFRELLAMDADCKEFTAYVVEVCQGCGWNHLVTSYVLGRPVPPRVRASRPRRTESM